MIAIMNPSTCGFVRFEMKGTCPGPLALTANFSNFFQS